MPGIQSRFGLYINSQMYNGGYMGKQRLLIVSDSTTNLEEVVEKVDDIIQAKGGKIWGPVSYPTAPFDQMRRVVYDFKEPNKEKYRWLEQINTTIGDGLSRNGPTRIYGCGFGIQSRIDLTTDSITERISFPEGTYTRAISESNSQTGHSYEHAPFSYDPAQDYYTETDQ